MYIWTTLICVFLEILRSYGVDSNLVEARQKEICIYQLDDSADNGFLSAPPNCFLRNLTFAAALAIDVRDKYYFYSDLGEKILYKVDLQQTTPRRDEILYGWGSIEGLAVDWMTDNIFWTDSALQHVAVSRYDGSHRHIIIYDDIGEPRGIALHPAKGYLFWSDISSSSRIERTDMTGQNRVILINFSLVRPNGLTVDSSLERLYFVDGGNDNIEYIDFNGLGRTLVQHENRGDFFDVAISGKFLFTTSFTSGIEVGALSTVSDPLQDTGPSSFMFRTITHEGYSFGLAIDDESAQPGTTASCGVFNGGCEQLCLPVDTSTFRCACGTGYTLNSDQRTCSSVILVEPFILVGDSSLNKIIQVDAHESYSSYSALPLDDTMNPLGIAYDPQENKIYWTDGALDQVSRSNLDGSEQEVIAFDNIEDPAGIAIDPVRRYLFWTDEGKDFIERASLDGSRREGYVTSGLDRPRGIAVNYINGDLFWTDWGASPKIERISEGRQNRVTLISTDLYRPNGIAVDPEADLLYWCDARGDSSRIELVKLDGSDRRILTDLSTSSHPFGLAINGNFLFYTDWNMNALLAIERFEDSPRALHFGPKVFMRMHGIASSYYVDPTSHSPASMLPPAAGSNGSQDDSSANELPIFIIAGGVAFFLVFICFTVALVFFRQKAKTRTRTRSQRLSRQPNIPIPPTPIANGAAAPIPAKRVDLPSDTPDPITGEHLYMDLDQLTSDEKDQPPPYSPPRPVHDPAFFDNPSMRRRDEPEEDFSKVHSYYNDRANVGRPNPRPDSIHDTYYIDPIGEGAASQYQSTIPSLPPTDYMEPSEVPVASSITYRSEKRQKPMHHIPSEYIKLKTVPNGGIGSSAPGPSEYMGLHMQVSEMPDIAPPAPPTAADDQYMDPLSTQDSQRVRRENERRSQIEANLRKSGFPLSGSYKR